MTFPYLIKKPQVYRMIAIWLSLFLLCNFSIIINLDILVQLQMHYQGLLTFIMKKKVFCNWPCN